MIENKLFNTMRQGSAAVSSHIVAFSSLFKARVKVLFVECLETFSLGQEK